MTISETTDYLQKILLTNGFIVHRYDAYSTPSCYLKLDYGACNSIRISNHKSKEHLKYKYNVDFSIRDGGYWRKPDNKSWRYYCSPTKNQLSILIGIILNDRFYKQTTSNYNELIEANKWLSTKQRGFWQQCFEVTDSGVDKNEHSTTTATNKNK